MIAPRGEQPRCVRCGDSLPCHHFWCTKFEGITFADGYIKWADGLTINTNASLDDLEVPEVLAYAQKLRDEHMRKHCAVTDGAN